ncbi:putative cation channel family transporter [Aspergillus ambiguus]|uniref:ion transporter n=1 Tax=Aspergillus ambiguus TaxID=176160 RepID=UPI003CCD700B
MLASLLRPKKRRVYAERSPFSSPYTTREAWPILQRDPESRYDDRRDHPDVDHAIEQTEYDDEVADGEEEDGPIESTPLLPIFSASHLDSLPVYDITHAIRPLIVARCETTLTWDQLRSPQVSQFLVKPIQQKIRSYHFSRATLYALLTNCLQFNKEIHLNPGNSGVNQTRAMVSELLAIKLLREYTTRELIDALLYEFYPLQGQPVPGAGGGWQPASGPKVLPGAARISCLEIAIRTQAKRFLSHPLVVQQLEAIWAGTIVFHSAADYLHRTPPPTGDRNRLYGAVSGNPPTIQSTNASNPRSSDLRRSVTLYDPRDASLFKLSRLRVPRYRQFLSTLSFAVLLALFLAVLQRRHVEITSLEVVFWFWSTGFMLDEIVGFNEQGFSLYLMSFWNLFDLGILCLLLCYYCMRLYGALMPITRTHAVANQAYDILAANAVLLIPRLFSVLDHYRYFSQLLIAFRIMASDLVAVFLLIIIACSGFFVAFTLSFGQGPDQSPGSVAFALFQMLMGFTPTAWTLWDEYNTLGKVILTIFLFICHFVVVTILITVLTNSFMSIVQNANQEHQFLFAVNTISMVKSDALFSYVAPTNILAWLITPLRYLMPFRQFVRVNRTIIKITHLPILFTICLYEKTILSSNVVEPTDLVDPQIPRALASRPRPLRHSRFKAFNSNAPRLVREPSVATYQKDRALEEVFRQPFQGPVRGRRRDLDTRESNNIVHNWMKNMGSGPVHPPDEQDSDEVSRLEKRPRRLRYPARSGRTRSLRDFTASNRSAVSNPEEQVDHIASSPQTPRPGRAFLTPTRTRQLSRHTGMEGDDELTSEDNDDCAEDQRSSDDDRTPADNNWGRSPETPGKATPKFYSSRPSTAKAKSRKTSPTRRPRHHTRNASAATMLYNPLSPASNGEESETVSIPVRRHTRTPERGAPANISTSVDHWTLRRHSLDDSRSRNLTMPRSNPMSVPDLGNFLAPESRYREHRKASVLDALGSDLGDNRAIANGFLGGMPMSLTTQMAYATGGIRRPDSPSSSQDMLSKLVLARMNNIEEGFREVIREVKDLRREGTSRSQSRPDELRGNQREKRKRVERKASNRKLQGSRKSKTSSEGRRSDELSVESRLLDV